MSLTLTILFYAVVFLGIIKLYLKLTTVWCTSNVCLIGKTAIVTGANCGIGYETAEDFAKRGAKVILACRDEGRGSKAVEKIIKSTDNKNVFFKQLDLSSLESVRKFVEDINKSEKRLDILVNNAGVGTYGKEKSENGLLMLMQINYFSPFLLTYLLLDLLRNTSNSRIINVSSIVAKYVNDFDVEALNNFPKSKYDSFANTKLYSFSKLCNILFTIELSKKLKGTSTTTYSLHPGIGNTEILRKVPPIIKLFIGIIFKCFCKSPIEAAQTSIYCSVAKGIEQMSGEHFHECHRVKTYNTAEDPELAKQLWKTTKHILNLLEIM
ncbi:retinol dehydrogenase 11-like [Euwallacea fornicatus]|uniref:retinol dehydrogenase 11-like n=1 Tax=Euwallacea fornicatus TaxID=995702 RepID=UPI00338FB168